jgi:hypothetical protein
MLASYNLNRDSERTHRQMSKPSDLNIPVHGIEYFLVKDDDGGTPRSDASVNLTIATRRSHEQHYHIPSVRLPKSSVDMALTMPLLRSFAYSFTGKGISIVEYH